MALVISPNSVSSTNLSEFHFCNSKKADTRHTDRLGTTMLESFLQIITLLVHILWSVLAYQLQTYLSTFFKKKS